jgi:phage-related protein (TIGR01555 family)
MPEPGKSAAQQITEYTARSIQRSFKDMKAVDDAGNALEGVGMDSFGDMQTARALNSIGGFMPVTQFGWFASQGFIGWQTAAILSQHWLIDKACTMPGDDAVRHGYEITVNDGDDVDPKLLDEMHRLDKKFKIKQNCREFMKMGRIFGIRHAMFIVDSADAEYYAKPFNPDGVTPGSYKGISQIDPYWIAPELSGQAASNPASMDFYEPTWWRVNGKRVHRSHMVIMRNGDDLPDILKPSYLYGGIPIPQKIAERVYAAERTANEAPLLAMTKRLTAIKCDADAALANPEAFQMKMETWVGWRDNMGIKVIGMGEEIEQFDTSLAELDATIMTQYQLVAAASNVPATKLLGTQPKGFNASGEYEEASYHEELETIQENILSPLVERHHLLLMRSYIAPKFSVAPFHTEVTWKPVDSPTAKEQAEMNKLKADTDGVLVSAGAIDGLDVRHRLIADADSGFNGIDAIVPGGPGDREAEQAEKEAMMQAAQEPGDAETAD